MAQPQIIRLTEVPAVPWRNGLGSTRVIAGPEPGARWRLSVAELEQDGNFSAFEGWDRTFCVYGQNPVELTVAGTARLLSPGEVLSFDGTAEVRAALPEGPSQALNLMVRRGLGTGAVSVLHMDSSSAQQPAADTVAVVPLQGEVQISGNLCRRGEVLLHPEGSLSGLGDAVVALVSVSSA